MIHSQGAFRQTDGAIHWCIWAPFCQSVELILADGLSREYFPMSPLPGGYFTTKLDNISGNLSENLRYGYRLNHDRKIPDPTSRFQPDGVFELSAIPEDSFVWTDADWKGTDPHDLILCALSVIKLALFLFRIDIVRIGETSYNA